MQSSCAAFSVTFFLRCFRRFEARIALCSSFPIFNQTASATFRFRGFSGYFRVTNHSPRANCRYRNLTTPIPLVRDGTRRLLLFQGHFFFLFISYVVLGVQIHEVRSPRAILPVIALRVSSFLCKIGSAGWQQSGRSAALISLYCPWIGPLFRVERGGLSLA